MLAILTLLSGCQDSEKSEHLTQLSPETGSVLDGFESWGNRIGIDSYYWHTTYGCETESLTDQLISNVTRAVDAFGLGIPEFALGINCSTGREKDNNSRNSTNTHLKLAWKVGSKLGKTRIEMRSFCTIESGVICSEPKRVGIWPGGSEFTIRTQITIEEIEQIRIDTGSHEEAPFLSSIYDGDWLGRPDRKGHYVLTATHEHHHAGYLLAKSCLNNQTIPCTLKPFGGIVVIN